MGISFHRRHADPDDAVQRLAGRQGIEILYVIGAFGVYGRVTTNWYMICQFKLVFCPRRTGKARRDKYED